MNRVLGIAPSSVSERPPARRSLAPLEPVSTRARLLLGVGFFVLFFAAWSVFTLGGFVSPTFLASPITMAVTTSADGIGSTARAGASAMVSARSMIGAVPPRT